MKVTKIELQKKNRKRYNIYLDGKFSFGLSEETVLTKGLRLGREIDQKGKNEILEQEKYEKAFVASLRLLTFRKRSSFEMKDRLKRKGYDDRIIKKVVEKLTLENLLSDDDFARFWIEGRTGRKPRGRFLVRRELLQKGVDEATIDKNLDLWYNIEKEKELALSLAKKEKDKGKDKNYLYQALIRRGFSGETTLEAIDKVFAEEKIIYKK